MCERIYYVYILTSATNTVLYTGNLERRLHEHRNGLTPVFASKYRCHKLVWFGAGSSVEAAIVREKQVKAGSRAKKIALIEAMNPQWADLYPER